MFAATYPVHLTFVLVYLVALIGVGWMKASKIKTQEDFSLAGRGLPTIVLIGTLLATWIGTGSIFGNAEKTYENGAAGLLLPIGGALGVIALVTLAGRIRRFEQFTTQDILQARFGGGARVMGTITLLLAYVIIVSYQYRSGSAVLDILWPQLSGWSESLGMQPNALAILIVALFVILYTALAGMVSVAYTDLVNGIIMILGIALALPILFKDVGGMEGVRASLSEEQLQIFGTFSNIKLISITLPAFLLILGDANMYQRFFSAKSPAVARRAAILLFFGVLLLELAIISTALLGRALVAQAAADPANPLLAPENPAHIILHLAFHALPTWLGAMMVATIVAIVVSTADSFLLAPSTSLVRDVYQKSINKNASPATLVRMGRIIVVVLGLVALGLAFTSDEFFSVAIFAYTIYGAGITPALIAAFFWRRATATGAVMGMATGVVTAILWHFFVVDADFIASLQAREWDGMAELCQKCADMGLDEVIPALFANVAVLVTVSLLGSPPEEAQSNAI